MSALGDKLRAAREQRNLSIAEAARETHIRGLVIEALEAGEYKKLPPPPFTRGLLKNYAAFLKLDPELILEDYAVESGLKPAPVPPAPPSLPEITSLPIKRPTTPLPERPPLFTSPPPPPPRRVVPPTRPEPVEPAPAPGQALSSTEAPPRLPSFDETMFQVAPELSEERVPAPDPANWVQRLSATRLPEAVAALALGVALLAIAIFAYARFFPAPASTAQPLVAAAVESPTRTPSRVTTQQPTPVPTFRVGASNENQLALVATPTGRTVVAALPTLNVPPDAQMTVQITADQPMGVWIVADNVEVFRGNLTGETRTWTAHQRLYVQVKNLPNGTVVFNGKQILARVFAERQVLERAWQMNAKGVPLQAEAATFLTPPAPTATPTFTPTPTPTPTVTPTSTSTPTQTPTLTPTLSPTPTETPLFSPTPTQAINPAPTSTEPSIQDCAPNLGASPC
jgi:transcriptional regulator with XRE-family HTH domain